MGGLIDLRGRVFDRLTVIARHVTCPPNLRYVFWECECECGNVVNIRSDNLLRGRTTSCGCNRSLYREANKLPCAIGREKHGLSQSEVVVQEYLAWRGMFQRCYNTKNKDYSRYGGKGVKVCRSWQENFVNFLNDMGTKPSILYSLDRINPHGDYEPSNCRWATRVTQSRNKRLSKNNTSGQKGIGYDITIGKFKVSIGANNKQFHLGYCENLEEAVLARKAGELKYWGVMSNHG